METKLGNFSSYEPPKRLRYKSSGNKNTRGKSNSTDLMRVKIGLCLAICIVVVMVNVFLSPFMARISKFAENPSNTDDEGVLGRLRFVELPSILEVFAGGDKLTLPVNYQSASLDSTNTELNLKCSPYSTVTTCAEGVVKTVAMDEKYGMYLVIRHDDDLESLYYGFSTITVEEAQPIKKLDTLGVLGESGELIIKVTQYGAPKNPCEFFPISSIAKR